MYQVGHGGRRVPQRRDVDCIPILGGRLQRIVLRLEDGKIQFFTISVKKCDLLFS